MSNRERFLALLAVILLGTGSFIYFRYSELQRKYDAERKEAFTQSFNQKVLDFSDLFVNKILKAEGEVSLEDRLGLENAVRDLNDEEIKKWWDAFVDSKTETDAQTAVKNLLAVLVRKIKIQ